MRELGICFAAAALRFGCGTYFGRRVYCAVPVMAKRYIGLERRRMHLCAQEMLGRAICDDGHSPRWRIGELEGFGLGRKHVECERLNGHNNMGSVQSDFELQTRLAGTEFRISACVIVLSARRSSVRLLPVPCVHTTLSLNPVLKANNNVVMPPHIYVIVISIFWGHIFNQSVVFDHCGVLLVAGAYAVLRLVHLRS